MVRRIRVRRGPGGWVVEAGAGVLGFARAGEAERWARSHAQAMAEDGDPVELQVFDLRDALVGAIVFHPRLATA